MSLILFLSIIILCLVQIFLQFRILSKNDNSLYNDFKNKFDIFELQLNKIENSVKDEFSRNREETNKQSKDNREELSASFRTFSDSILNRMTENVTLQKNQFDTFNTTLIELKKSLDERLERLITNTNESLKGITDQNQNISKANREELSKSLKSFEERFDKSVKDFVDIQIQKFSELILKQEKLNETTSDKLEKMRTTVEGKMTALQEDNSKKLEEMRKTVDEKLHETLEKRLGESFKQVSERLELVHKGLGEMQVLATGVGDLKKVLSNVKSRGILGEYQLANLLEQFMSPEQFATNVKTKPGSSNIVEFAIKLPGKNDIDKVVYLPVDSKFPIEDYHALLDAYEAGNPELVSEKSKQLTSKIKSFAKDIHDKYIEPPYTTDFGIMFLPFEGLYAEVLRNPGLFESILKDYKVTIAGPTTLSAFLNSLQMGFRTLAIEKRSGEVWELLGAIKTEFHKFGDIIQKTKEKIDKASSELDSVNIRSRAIERKLKNVQQLPSEKSQAILGEDKLLDFESENN